MKTLPIAGTAQTVTFFEDDTVDTVRQWVALSVKSHPDRLFLTVKGKFPRDYYSSNPKRWTDLFYRLSYDGTSIRPETLKSYLTQVRPDTAMTETEVTREMWESHDESLSPIYAPEVDFEEWRILGVNESKSMVMPFPPADIPLPSARIPIPSNQSLFETFHSYPVVSVGFLEHETSMSPTVTRVYFPLLRPDTPPTNEPRRAELTNAQEHLQKLLALHVPPQESLAVVRAKWFVPLVSTHFTSPRARFEQIFYGMTVSKTVPYIGYFTAKSEAMRNKYYVEDPKQKTPVIDPALIRGWISATLPQRRRPTLLLYRGTSRSSFERIAVTPEDMTFSIYRTKDSKETMEDMKATMKTWLETLDALIPFVDPNDISDERWELGDVSVVAEYAKEVNEFDMRRFNCLQSLFGQQGDAFRLLRAEYASSDISPREIQAYQILNQDDSEDSAEYLAREMNVSESEANELFQAIKSKSEDTNFEKTLKAYPVVTFGSKEMLLKFSTHLDRTMQYVNILRHVLSSDTEDVNEVCPRRLERVEASSVVLRPEIPTADFKLDDDFFSAMGLGDEALKESAPPPDADVVTEPKSKKRAVGTAVTTTFNYFNTRLQKFDPATFDKTVHTKACEKLRQVVALTEADKERLGPEYNYEDADPTEKMEVSDPEGTLICPPYFCIRDEAPLRREQLVEKEDGLHCPICDGKLRNKDDVDIREYTVIERKTALKYPNLTNTSSTLNGRKIPCCYQQPRTTTEVLGERESGDTYVLSKAILPSLRFNYLDEALAKRLGVQTSYATTVTKNKRLVAGEQDVFRLGLGRPSKTLPNLLGNKKTEIKRPRDARENVMKCSFFRTWTRLLDGTTQTDRIINGIDYAYEHGELSIIDEVEYVASFLRCEVIRVNTETMDVMCGFWSDRQAMANQYTIVLLDTDILASVSLRRTSSKLRLEYNADLRKSPFASTVFPRLRELHLQACSIQVPVLADAIKEVVLQGKREYGVVLDPFERIQAVYVPGSVILPISPTGQTPDPGVRVKPGYSDLTKEELPTGPDEVAFLQATQHPGFKVVKDHQDLGGMLVELELSSGFRVPIRPMQAETPKPPSEVTETLRTHKESELVDAPPSASDIKLAESISYDSEMYEFLLFSLAKDLQEEDHAGLRGSIASRSATMLKDLTQWFKEEAYTSTTESPVEFVNKVRTPCGQYTNKDACSTSTLCGWHKNTCKIRVKKSFDTSGVLKRLAKTLRDNDKTRSLVLDNRVSPFFSTILYLEMPHELITTGVA
jgi:predicted transcriptional regulator